MSTDRRLLVRILFTDYPGAFLFHCSVLVREDHGMLAVVKVVDRGRPPLAVPVWTALERDSEAASGFGAPCASRVQRRSIVNSK